MAFRDTYRKQVALLVRILPHVAEGSCFALKGGTAINLFVRAMPRLSVDIDLTYVPVAPRAESLAAIDAAMKRIVARVQKAIPDAKITSSGSEGAITQLIVRQGGVQTKIEVTPVLRGCVYQPQTRARVRRGRGRIRLRRNAGCLLCGPLCRQDRCRPRPSAPPRPV